MAKKDRLFSTAWVHVFEEDTADGAVYRPEDADIPLSRRPRERLELDADGSARLFAAGPDDGFVAQPARWEDASGTIIVRAPGRAELRIVNRSPDRLVIRRGPFKI